MTLTLDEAQQNLGDVVRKALGGEEVTIKVGAQDIPLRPPGYFSACYQDPKDAAFEERISRDSKPSLEE